MTFVSLDAIRAARAAIAGAAVRTPLVRLGLDDAPAEIYLKLENLQPIGSFKIRAAGNAMSRLAQEQVARGVLTASTGNMAQGVAWNARRMGIPCTVVMPETAPPTKIQAVERLGARIIHVSFDRWWQTFTDRAYPGVDATFVHPFDDLDVMAGNGTIGLEILEDLPEVEAVVVPWGGGGLACGIAAAIRALRPSCRVFAAEVSTGAPLAPSLAARRPVTVDYIASFVTGMGGKTVLPTMLERALNLIQASLVVDIDEVAAAVRLIAERNQVVSEGAGAAALAAALGGGAGTGKVACVVSGGNIDSAVLAQILRGEVPLAPIDSNNERPIRSAI